jgi:hypothetical protein
VAGKALICGHQALESLRRWERSRVRMRSVVGAGDIIAKGKSARIVAVDTRRDLNPQS